MMDDGPNPLPPELVELLKRVETMPRRRRRELLPLCGRLAAMTRLYERLVTAAQQAVDHLQLDLTPHERGAVLFSLC